MDRSVKPGDSFWKYALGKWLKKHSKSDEGYFPKDKDDVISANHVRVNGIMRLMDDWYTLFDVQPDDELYVKPEDRVKIW